MKLLPVLILLTTSVSSFANASKILFLLPIASKSHRNVFDPLIEALAVKNHEITVISPVNSKIHPSIKEIVPAPLNEVMRHMENTFEIRKQGRLSFFLLFNATDLETTCHKLYQNEEVRNLLKNSTFDLIILNGLANQCVQGLVGYFKSPFIILTTLPAPNSVTEKVGNHLPYSFIPSPFLEFTDRMTFFQRVANVIFDMLIKASTSLRFDPKMEKLYRYYLGEEIPSLKELDRNLSMIFMNTHFTMTYPRPLLPSIVEVGGMHCRPGKPLPKELDDFLSSAENGFILFSLGSIVNTKSMPESTKRVFLNVFSRLKQKVIWKWEDDTMANLPANVKISKWLPQQDILAHKKIKIFLTHGGLLSTQEAVYHGIPVIGIPMFADQDLNMKQAETLGFGRMLEILDITEERLETLIKDILNQPQYAEKAKALSAVYRDQPQSSLERAVFWTEYVIRHKGAPHLQSAARDLNVFQYHSLDVILFLLGTLCTIVLILKHILCQMICKLCRRKSPSSIKKLTTKSKKKQ